jgi:hypothetical protein
MVDTGLRLHVNLLVVVCVCKLCHIDTVLWCCVVRVSMSCLSPLCVVRGV